MGTLTQEQWDTYKAQINSAQGMFNQETVTWRRSTHGLQRWGIDDDANLGSVDISLLCLISFNWFRTWPITGVTDVGDMDKQNMVMWLNMKYLRDSGYTNASDQFDFQPGKDIFLYKGQEYRAAGETHVSQADDDPLFYQVILRRQETPTGTKKY